MILPGRPVDWAVMLERASLTRCLGRRVGAGMLRPRAGAQLFDDAVSDLADIVTGGQFDQGDFQGFAELPRCWSVAMGTPPRHQQHETDTGPADGHLGGVERLVMLHA